MSWYQDALQQQGVSAADLKALLAADNVEELDKTRGTDNDNNGDGVKNDMIAAAKEVAEQRKIIALHRARQLLEESIGRTYVPPKPLDLMNRPRSALYQPQLGLPPRPIRTAALERLTARQTCLIPPNVPINISMDEKNPILIDLSVAPKVQLGDPVPDETTSVPTRGTIIVQCNACALLLRVSLTATLVRCSECHELSPASDRAPPVVATMVPSMAESSTTT